MSLASSTSDYIPTVLENGIHTNCIGKWWQCPLLAPSVHSPQMCGWNELEVCTTLIDTNILVHSVLCIYTNVCGRNELKVCTTLTYIKILVHSVHISTYHFILCYVSVDTNTHILKLFEDSEPMWLKADIAKMTKKSNIFQVCRYEH